MSPKRAVADAAPRFTPVRRRAVGIIRVSEVDGRSGESFRSPGDQQSILDRHCLARNYNLVATFEELDVSGYSIQQIDKRKRGLAPALAMIERGEADVLLLPWLDRIARNLQLYKTAVKRVKAAGGTIEAVDFGEVTGGSAAQRFSAETLIHVAEFFAELTGEKTHEAQEKAIAEGIPTFDHIPYGYRKDPMTRRLVVEPDEAEVVRQVFHMREADATLEAIRDFLRGSKGCRPIGIRGVQNMLKSRMYLGELHFGKLSNMHSHEAIVDPGLFRTVQGKRVSRNQKRSSSELLLARLGVARCAECGGALVVGSQWQTRAGGLRRRYDDYRCSNMGDCKQRVHISAPVLDEAVIRYLKRLEAEGHATVDEELEAAEQAYLQAEEELSNMISLLNGLGDLAAARTKLDGLKARREEAFEHWQSLRALRGSTGIRSSDWDNLTINAQRALIRSRIRTVLVSRSTTTAHTPDRIKIEPFTQ